MDMRCHLHDRCVLTPRNASCKRLCYHDQQLRWAVTKLYCPARAPTRLGTAGVPGNSRFTTPQRHARLAASFEQDTSVSSDSDDEKAFAENIWQPVPPTPALGRKRKVALLLGCAILEISATGACLGYFWSAWYVPSICGLLHGP